MRCAVRPSLIYRMARIIYDEDVIELTRHRDGSTTNNPDDRVFIRFEDVTAVEHAPFGCIVHTSFDPLLNTDARLRAIESTTPYEDVTDAWRDHHRKIRFAGRHFSFDLDDVRVAFLLESDTISMEGVDHQGALVIGFANGQLTMAPNADDYHDALTFLREAGYFAETAT